MNDYVRVALVAKPKSLDGWVVCRRAGDLPFALRDGLEVFFVPPSLLGPRQAVVAEMRALGTDTWDVHFEGIDTPEDARAICGCICLAAQCDVETEQARTAVSHMVGCTLVEAKAGEVGRIVEVRPGVAQDLLVVETPDGREVLVPAVDAFLGVIDEKARTVHATLPDGLLDLE